MSGPLASSFSNQLAELVDRLREMWRPDSPECLFALHVFAAVGEQGPVGEWPQPDVPTDLEAGQAPVLATAGYLLSHEPSVTPHFASAWTSGLRRLSVKDAFPPDRQSFV